MTKLYYEMKGIITTNDFQIVKILAESFPFWVIIVSNNSKLVEFFPLPN